MRVLLDECLPQGLRSRILDHDVRTVKYMGWAGVDNGELLQRMFEAGFNAFLTVDKNIPSQRNLEGVNIAIVVLSAPSNRMPDLLPLVPEMLSVLDRIKPGEIVTITPP